MDRWKVIIIPQGSCIRKKKGTTIKRIDCIKLVRSLECKMHFKCNLFDNYLKSA